MTKTRLLWEIRYVDDSGRDGKELSKERMETNKTRQWWEVTL
jgi:hypothetical protein